MSKPWIRFGRVAVVVVGLVVAALSYAHIRDLALTYGGDSLTAPLLPLGIDGAVVAMTVFMHQANGLALWLSRFGLLVAIGMTVAFNTAYGAAFGVTGAVIWASPAVLLVICVEVSVLTVRRPAAVSDTVTVVTKPQVSDATEREPVIVTEEFNAMAAKVTARKPSKAKENRIARVRRLLEQSPPLTVAQIAARTDVHPRTVARYKAALNNGGPHG